MMLYNIDSFISEFVITLKMIFLKILKVMQKAIIYIYFPIMKNKLSVDSSLINNLCLIDESKQTYVFIQLYNNNKYIIYYKNNSKIITYYNFLPDMNKIKENINKFDLKISDSEIFSIGKSFVGKNYIEIASLDLYFYITNDMFILRDFNSDLNIKSKNFMKIESKLSQNNTFYFSNDIKSLESEHVDRKIVSNNTLLSYPKELKIEYKNQEQQIVQITEIIDNLNVHFMKNDMVYGIGYCMLNNNIKLPFIVTTKFTCQDILKNTESLVKNRLDLFFNENMLKECCFMVTEKELSYSKDDIDQYVMKPIRDILARPFKSWRSFIYIYFLASMGAKIDKYIDIIIIIEILQSGSLIIDDIEDESTIRRGDKCIHLKYGTSTAINSGNLCYYIYNSILEKINDSKKIKLYESINQFMINSHIGQGLDIKGLHHVINEYNNKQCSKEELYDKLLNKILNIHMMKTGSFISCIMIFGCIISEKEILIKKCIDIGKNIGIAYQIIDDVLTMDGTLQKNNVKELMDDIKEGKVTFPIIMSIKYLKDEELNFIFAKLSDHKNITENDAKKITELIGNTKSLQDSRDMAKIYYGKSLDSMDSINNKSVHLKLIKILFDKLLNRV